MSDTGSDKESRRNTGFESFGERQSSRFVQEEQRITSANQLYDDAKFRYGRELPTYLSHTFIPVLENITEYFPHVFNVAILGSLQESTKFQTILAIALVFHHITLSSIGYMLLTHLLSSMDHLIASGDLALLKISFQRKMVICLASSVPFIVLQFFSKEVLTAIIPRFSDEIISKASTFIKYMIPYFMLNLHAESNKVILRSFRQKKFLIVNSHIACALNCGACWYFFHHLNWGYLSLVYALWINSGFQALFTLINLACYDFLFFFKPLPCGWIFCYELGWDPCKKTRYFQFLLFLTFDASLSLIIASGNLDTISAVLIYLAMITLLSKVWEAFGIPLTFQVQSYLEERLPDKIQKMSTLVVQIIFLFSLCVNAILFAYRNEIIDLFTDVSRVKSKLSKNLFYILLGTSQLLSVYHTSMATMKAIFEDWIWERVFIFLSYCIAFPLACLVLYFNLLEDTIISVGFYFAALGGLTILLVIGLISIDWMKKIDTFTTLVQEKQITSRGFCAEYYVGFQA